MGNGESFGVTLRQLRIGAGMRQVDLAATLGLARSTLANIERGAEAPTHRLWARLRECHPDWQADLQQPFEDARQSMLEQRSKVEPMPSEPFLGGPFHLEKVSYTYVFAESRSPSEIIEVRRVRALAPGATCFGLRIRHTDTPGFRVDQEHLWGGELADAVVTDDEIETSIWRRLNFGRRLRLGEHHEFAIRSWVEHDPEPATDINFNVTLPTTEAAIHLAFLGSHRPVRAWRYGPIEPDQTTPPEHRTPLRLMPGGSITARFRKPTIGLFYGLTWAWAD